MPASTLRRSLAPLLALALALPVAIGARPSAAQPELTHAMAHSAFEEGMKLYKAGAFLAACEKLDESLRLDPQMGTRFWLADCYEHLGRTASAWSNFITVANDAKRANNATREATARARAEALAPNLTKLVVNVPPAVRGLAGLEVRRDGEVVAHVLWGTPVPVDPGVHRVRVQATGKHPWEFVVNVGPTGGRVDVQPLTDEVAPPPPALPMAPPPPAAGLVVAGPPPGPVAAAPPPASDAPSAGAWHRPTAWAMGGVGAAGLILGGAFGGLALSTWHTAEGLCTPRCAAGASSKSSTATTYATISDVGFAVGGAAAVAALAIGLTAPSASASPRVGLRVAPTPGGLMAVGSFEWARRR
jgi:hypothetical protein